MCCIFLEKIKQAVIKAWDTTTTWTKTQIDKISTINISKEDIKEFKDNVCKGISSGLSNISAKIPDGVKTRLEGTGNTMREIGQVLSKHYTEQMKPDIDKLSATVKERYKELEPKINSLLSKIGESITNNAIFGKEEEIPETRSFMDAMTPEEIKADMAENAEAEAYWDKLDNDYDDYDDYDDYVDYDEPTENYSEANSVYREAISATSVFLTDDKLQAMEKDFGLSGEGTTENISQIREDMEDGRLSPDQATEKFENYLAQTEIYNAYQEKLEAVEKYETAIKTGLSEGMLSKNDDGTFSIDRNLGTNSRFEHLEEGTVLPSVEDFKETTLSEIASVYERFSTGDISGETATDMARDLFVGDIRDNPEIGYYDPDSSFFRTYDDMKEAYYDPNSSCHKEAGEPFVSSDLSLACLTHCIDYNTEYNTEKREAMAAWRADN